MYSISKYSFFCINKAGDLLMYNSYVGVDSFCKIKKGSFSKDILKSKKVEYLPAEYYKALLKKGIIIDEDVNERKRLISIIVLRPSQPDLQLT